MLGRPVCNGFGKIYRLMHEKPYFLPKSPSMYALRLDYLHKSKKDVILRGSWWGMHYLTGLWVVTWLNMLDGTFFLFALGPFLFAKDAGRDVTETGALKKFGVRVADDGGLRGRGGARAGLLITSSKSCSRSWASSRRFLKSCSRTSLPWPRGTTPPNVVRPYIIWGTLLISYAWSFLFEEEQISPNSKSTPSSDLVANGLFFKAIFSRNVFFTRPTLFF